MDMRTYFRTARRFSASLLDEGDCRNVPAQFAAFQKLLLPGLTNTTASSHLESEREDFYEMGQSFTTRLILMA